MSRATLRPVGDYSRRRRRLLWISASTGATFFLLFLGFLIRPLDTSPPEWPPPDNAPEARRAAEQRGQYVFQIAGCLGCHTDEKNNGPPLAGGRALATPFGTFFSPNITPDRAGLGGWDENAFFVAMRRGVRPDGSSMFPVFPFPSYTLIRDQDLRDLWAWLRAQTPRPRPNSPHQVAPPFGWRMTLPFWRLLYFGQGPLTDDPNQSPAWNRGRYLVKALGHCGECHTPRDPLGGMREDRFLAGAPHGPEGGKVPGLAHLAEKTGIGGWSNADLDAFLESGLMPDGDVVGGPMGEVVRNSTSKLTQSDRAAIIAYLRSLP